MVAQLTFQAYVPPCSSSITRLSHRHPVCETKQQSLQQEVRPDAVEAFRRISAFSSELRIVKQDMFYPTMYRPGSGTRVISFGEKLDDSDLILIGKWAVLNLYHPQGNALSGAFYA